jgi:hypothetical protein
MGRILENGGTEELIIQFSVDVWNQAGNCIDNPSSNIMMIFPACSARSI